MTVGIIIICYNISSEIFLLQIAAIKKFCQDDYEILIIDNSSDPELSEHIRYHSSHQGLNYTKTFAGGKNSSDSHSFAANFAYQKFKDQFEYMFFCDHDLVAVEEFSVVKTLNGGHVAGGIGQEKNKKYFWPGCFYLANNAIEKDIVDFSPAEGLDTGGNLYRIIEKYGEEACVFFNESYHENPYFKDKQYGYYAMINNETFLHCVNGSNWFGTKNNAERMSALVNVIKEKTGL